MPGEASARAVLVVDDEVILGRSVKRMLARDYQVTLATSAHEALALFASGISFDLILCDLMMPSMTGMDLFDELRRTQPGVAARFVFVTGGAFTERARRFLEEVPNARLEKPFDSSALRELVSAQISMLKAER